MGVGVQHHTSVALAPEMTRYPLCRRLGGPQGRCGKSRLQRDSIPDRPAIRESLNRLSYTGPHSHSEEFCNVYYWGNQTGARMDVDYSSKTDMKNAYDILFGLPGRKKKPFWFQSYMEG